MPEWFGTCSVGRSNNSKDHNNAIDAHAVHNIQLNIYQWLKSLKNRIVFRQYLPEET
jgi:hypothetical protein